MIMFHSVLYIKWKRIICRCQKYLFGENSITISEVTVFFRLKWSKWPFFYKIRPKWSCSTFIAITWAKGSSKKFSNFETIYVPTGLVVPRSFWIDCYRTPVKIRTGSRFSKRLEIYLYGPYNMVHIVYGSIWSELDWSMGTVRRREEVCEITSDRVQARISYSMKLFWIFTNVWPK